MNPIGHIVYELAPSEEFSRHSEGAFITRRDGGILFIWTRYEGNHLDDGAADLCGIISTDNGEHFSGEKIIFPRQRLNAKNVMSVSLLRLGNGDIGLFFLKKEGDYPNCLCRMFMSRSSDEGETFADPVQCHNEEGYFVVANDRVIRLRDGRLLIPTAGHGRGEQGLQDTKCIAYLSDDDGATWYMGGETMLPPMKRYQGGLQEPSAIELTDGRIWCLCRTGLGRQYECYSEDGGLHWSNPEPSWFTSPHSPLMFRRLRDGRIMAVWNPLPIVNGQKESRYRVWTGGRYRLVMAFSSDEGETFSAPQILEEDMFSGFGYPSSIQLADGSVLMSYCAGRPGDGLMLSRLRIRKISAEEI